MEQRRDIVFHLCQSDYRAVTQARLKVVRTQARRCALWDRKRRSGSYGSRAVTTSGPIPRAHLPSRGIVPTALPGVSHSPCQEAISVTCFQWRLVCAAKTFHLLIIGAHIVSYQFPNEWLGVISEELKRLERAAFTSPPSVVLLKNVWGYMSTFSYVLVLWCLMKHCD
jgi:hypothetical protein